MANNVIPTPLDDDEGDPMTWPVDVGDGTLIERPGFDSDACACGGTSSRHPVGEPRWCVAFETERDRV